MQSDDWQNTVRGRLEGYIWERATVEIEIPFIPPFSGAEQYRVFIF